MWHCFTFSNNVTDPSCDVGPESCGMRAYFGAKRIEIHDNCCFFLSAYLVFFEGEWEERL